MSRRLAMLRLRQAVKAWLVGAGAFLLLTSRMEPWEQFEGIEWYVVWAIAPLMLGGFITLASLIIAVWVLEFDIQRPS